MGTPGIGPIQSRDARRKRRQTEIVDAVAHLFAQNGYSDTGMAELCEAVGLGGRRQDIVDTAWSLAFLSSPSSS